MSDPTLLHAFAVGNCLHGRPSLDFLKPGPALGNVLEKRSADSRRFIAKHEPGFETAAAQSKCASEVNGFMLIPYVIMTSKRKNRLGSPRYSCRQSVWSASFEHEATADFLVKTSKQGLRFPQLYSIETVNHEPHVG